MEWCNFKLDPKTNRYRCATCDYTYSPQHGSNLIRECRPAHHAPPTALPSQRPKGPGDHLHALIRRYTREDYQTGCGCEAMVRRMNAAGPTWCRQHLDEIVAKMLEEAKKRPNWKHIASLPGAKLFIKRMILSAIRKSECGPQ